MGYNSGITTMGGRAGGGAGGGSGKGGNTRTIQGLANKVVGGFTSGQKEVYDAMVAKGFNKVYAAHAVGSVAKQGTFQQQPLSWIKGQMAGNKTAADVARINTAMGNTPNKLISAGFKNLLG